VVVELGSEEAQSSQEREWGQPLVVAESACRTVGSQVGEELLVARPGCSVGEPLADLGDPAQPDPTGDRLAAGLVGTEADEEAGEVHDAGRFIDRDDGPRAHMGAHRSKRRERVGGVEHFG
jgi:hypothetical protein